MGQASASMGVLGAAARTARDFLPLTGAGTELCGVQWSRGHREGIRQLPGVWSILWLTFILTWAPQAMNYKVKCVKIPKAPMIPDAVAYLPQPLPQEQPRKATPSSMGAQGGKGKCPWTHCSSGLLELASGHAAWSCPWLGHCSSGMSLNRWGSGLFLSWLGFF